jgi:hypothetical protein
MKRPIDKRILKLGRFRIARSRHFCRSAIPGASSSAEADAAGVRGKDAGQHADECRESKSAFPF